MGSKAKPLDRRMVPAETVDKTVLQLFTPRKGRDLCGLLVFHPDGSIGAIEYTGSNPESALKDAGVEGYLINDGGRVKVPPKTLEGVLARLAPTSYYGILRRAEQRLARDDGALVARAFKHDKCAWNTREECEFVAALTVLQEGGEADLEVRTSDHDFAARFGPFVLLQSDFTHSYEEWPSSLAAQQWLSELAFKQEADQGELLFASDYVHESNWLRRGSSPSAKQILACAEEACSEGGKDSLASRGMVARYPNVSDEQLEMLVALDVLREANVFDFEVRIDHFTWAMQLGRYVIQDRDSRLTYKRHASPTKARRWMRKLVLEQSLHLSHRESDFWQGALPANYR